MPVDKGVGRLGQADHIRCQENGDYRDGYNDGVEEVAGNAQGDAQGSDDEGKFSNLGE